MKKVLSKVNKVASLRLNNRKTKYRGQSRQRVCKFHTDMLVQVGKNSAYILNLEFCSAETFK